MTRFVLASALVAIGLAVAQAEVLELEGTIKSIDASKREITVGTKTLDVAKKCRITIDGKDGTISDLKPEQKVVIEYDDELDVAKSITVGDPPDTTEALLKTIKGFQGEWLCVAAEEANKQTSPADVRRENRTLIVKGTSLAMERGKGQTAAKWEGKFSVDPSTNAFDWSGKSPDGSHVEWTGLYSLEGDTLKLCFRFSVDGSAPRPKKFSTSDWVKGTPMAFYTFKKVIDTSK